MTDAETHRELHKIPYHTCHFFQLTAVICSFANAKEWNQVYFTHFKAFGFCIWITLQYPSLSQLSLPQGGDISISPPCEGFSIYFIKVPSILALPKCRNTIDCKHDFHNAYTKSQPHLQLTLYPDQCKSTQFNSKPFIECVYLDFASTHFIMFLNMLMKYWFLV